MLDEPGADRVAAALEAGCAISIVNLAEVLGKLAETGADPDETLRQLGGLGDALQALPPGLDDAVAIAALRPLTKDSGLSLGDRACLALAGRLQVPALTADRSWAGLGGTVPVQVELIRF